MNIKSKQFAFLFYLILSVFLLRYIIFSAGAIGLKDDWCIAYTANQIQTQGYEHLYYWYMDNLGFSASYPADSSMWLLISIFGFFGFSGAFLSKLILVTCLTLSGYFVYCLLDDFKFDRNLAVLSGILYMFTPVMFNTIISGYFTYILSYMLFPIVLLYFFRVVNNNCVFDRNLIILSILHGLSAIHIQFFVINNFIFITYIIYHYFIIQRFSLRNLYLSAIVFNTIFVLINFYWIFPLLTLDVFNMIASKKESWIFLNAPNLLKSLMMHGGGYTYYFDTLRFSNGYIYWVVNYFALLMLVFCAMLYDRKNKLFLYVSFVFIFVVFIYKGQNPPFAHLGYTIYTNTIIGSLFRNVQYLAVLLSMSLVFMLSFSITWMKKKFGNKILYLIGFMLLIYLLPWYSGNLNEQVNIFELDDNYSSMSTFIKGDSGDYRVLYLPMSNAAEYKNAKITQFQEKRSRSFGLVYGLNPIVYSSEKSTLGNLYTDGDAVDSLDKEFHSYDGNNISKKLGLMNIKYIIFTTEFESKLQYYMGPEFSTKYDWSNNKIKDVLENQSNILLKQNISDKILIYENIDFYPHIYSANSQIIVQNSSVLDIIDSNDYSFIPTKQAIIVANQNYNKNIYSMNYTTRPNLLIQKINPTKYKVKIEDAYEPFYLIFSESYHPGWQAYINTDTMQCNPMTTYENVNITECQPESIFFEIKDLTRLFEKSIPEENHLVVNSYANAWYIDPQKLGTGENFSITLYFKPQFYFYIGLIISGLTFIGCIGYLLWNLQKKKNQH